MYTKLKLLNLLDKTETMRKSPCLPGGSIVNVSFRRSLSEKTKYNFKGICVAFRKRDLGSSIIVRNVIALYPLEYSFKIYSPLCKIAPCHDVTLKLKDRRLRKGKGKKAKLYYLRKKPAPLSKVRFHYV